MQTISQTVSQMKLGPVVTRTDIKSSLSPFHHFPEHKTFYPSIVIEALLDIYREYNHAFEPLVSKNKEWETDYQFSLTQGEHINWAVQIDMVGLNEEFLREAQYESFETVRPMVLQSIFEIENSVAMYQLLSSLFSIDQNPSFFRHGWHSVLDSIRKAHNKPIALLAVTDEKYAAMATSEFGHNPSEAITDPKVRELSGFDTFWGPAQFRQNVQENFGECSHLLYVRASDPVSKLRKPNSGVDHPLLSDAQLRRIIKENALTFNIDAPDIPYEGKINDTKAYMPSMQMGFHITSHEDLFTSEFEEYLQSIGVTLNSNLPLRAKPLKSSYGCYGHVRGILSDKKFLSEIRRNINLRGEYIVQPEKQTPVVYDSSEGNRGYTFIDRNFVGLVSGVPQFLGGFRNHMPLHTTEAREGRIHGNYEAVWSENLPEQ